MSDELQGETDERDPEGKRWIMAALCIGYNELAKQAKDLGSKVYFRLHRDRAEKEFVESGGNRFIVPEEPLATLDVGVGMPCVVFRKADIELMRKLVAEHDAALTQGGSQAGGDGS